MPSGGCLIVRAECNAVVPQKYFISTALHNSASSKQKQVKNESYLDPFFPVKTPYFWQMQFYGCVTLKKSQLCTIQI